MASGRIPYAGRRNDPYQREIWQMMRAQMDADQRFYEGERARSAEKWDAVGNLGAMIEGSYRGFKDREQAEADRDKAEELAQAQAQALIDREKFNLIDKLGLSRSALKALGGFTVPTVEDSPPVDVTSYTPAFMGEIARRAAQPVESLQVQRDREDGTLLEIMQRQDEERLIDPSIALPRPAPGTYDPTMPIASGYPGVAGYEVPVTTAETLAERKSEELLAEALRARQEADVERRRSREETLFEKSLEPGKVDDTNIFYNHEGRILPLILRETTSFNPKTKGYESKTTLLTAPDGQFVRHQDEDAVEWVSAGVNTGTGNMFVRNPVTNELKELPNATTSAIFVKGLEEQPEVENYAEIIADISADPGLNDWGQSPLEALGASSDDGSFSENFSKFYLTGPFSAGLKAWAKFFGTAEKSRSAEERINYANMMTLSALADNERMSEGEKKRISEYVKGIQGSFGKGAIAVRESMEGLGILLDEIVDTQGRNLDFTDSDEVQRFRNDASRIRLIQRLLGLESSVFDGGEGVSSDPGEFDPDF